MDVADDSRRAEVVAWLERECRGCHDSEDDGRFADLDLLMCLALVRSQTVW